MDTPQLIPGQSIPVSPIFAFEWNDPMEARGFWQMDVMHFPNQYSAMFEDFVVDMLDNGFNYSAQKFSLPIRQRSKIVNSYYYSTIAPVLDADGKPVEPPAGQDPSQSPVVLATLHLPETWENELLPQIKAIIAHFEYLDLRKATLTQLITTIDDAAASFKRLWEIHFETAMPMVFAMSFFDDFYQDVFGKTTFGAFKLLQGLDNKSLEADRALFALSRKARTLPQVMRILETQPSDKVMALLRMTMGGQTFLSDLDAWLREYGQRGDKFDTITSVGWIEDPTPVIKNLKDYVTRPDGDLDADRRHLAEGREQAIASARVELETYPEPVRGQFEALLRSAQVASVLQETHNYWIDQRATYQIRRVMLEAGRRLAAAGSIAATTDIIHLHIREIREALAALQDSPQNLRGIIGQRAAVLAKYARVQPPSMAGTLPDGAPPNNPVARAIGKFWGAPPEPADAPNKLRGNAGSPGTVRGIAKVIRNLDEAEKLQRGDILVAETTAPPWTPLFATAAAIVTDAGGILSHCALVAREYGIPAVVGTGAATHVIQDGMLIEVDGDNGVVSIVA